MLNVDSNVLLEQPEPEGLETSTDSPNLDKLTMKAMPFMYAHCHHYNKPYFIDHLVHRVVSCTIPKLRKQDLLYYTNKTNANLIYSFFKSNSTTSRPITEEKMIRVFEFLSNTHMRHLILPFSSTHQSSKITKASFLSLPDSVKFHSERNSFETPFASYTDFSKVDKQRSSTSSSNFKHLDIAKHYSTTSASSNLRSSIGISPFSANDAIVDLDQVMRQQKTDDSTTYKIIRTPNVMHRILSFCTPIVLCKFQLCSKRCYLMGGHNAIWSPYLFHFLLLMKDKAQIPLPVMEIPMGSTNQLFKHLYGQLMQYFEYHFVPESNYEVKCFSSFKFKESVFQPIIGSYNPSEKSLNSPNTANLQTTVLQSQSQDEMIENWLFLPMKQYMPYFIRTMKKFQHFETLFRNEHFINSIAIPRYLHFMKLQHLLLVESKKKNPNMNNTSLLLIPTLEIEFIWTCHALRYEQYKDFCLKNFGYVMEHYLKRRIDVFDFLQRLETTAQTWYSYFGSHYLDYPYIHAESDPNLLLTTNKFIEDIACNIKVQEVWEDLNWIKEYNHHLDDFVNMKQSQREHSTSSTNQLNQILRLYPLDVEKEYYHRQIESYMQILCMASNKLDKFFSYSHSHKSPTQSTHPHHLVPINWEIDSVWRCHFLNTEAYMLMSDSLLRGNIIPYCSYLAMESLEEEDKHFRGKHSLRHYHKEDLEYTKKNLKKLYSETGNASLESSKCILM